MTMTWRQAAPRSRAVLKSVPIYKSFLHLKTYEMIPTIFLVISKSAPLRSGIFESGLERSASEMLRSAEFFAKSQL